VRGAVNCSCSRIKLSTRVFLADGVDPATVLQMRHQGSGIVALRSHVGDAAGRSVLEGYWRRDAAVRQVAAVRAAGGVGDLTRARVSRPRVEQADGGVKG
jgi:hypothetical protein